MRPTPTLLRVRVTLALAVAPVLAAMLATRADANQGAAINVARVAFPATVAPGSEHEVRDIWISNPGSEPVLYRVEVRPVGPPALVRALRPSQAEPGPIAADAGGTASGPPADGSGGSAETRERVIQPGWFTVTPASFVLAPGGTAAVTVRVRVPSDAASARYQGHLSAAIHREGPGTSVGAAAAARIDLVVDGPVVAYNSLEPEKASAPTASGEVPPSRDARWKSPVLAAVLALAGALVVLGRRFSLRVERR